MFALVASPCASPVLVAVLAAASKDGSALHSVIAMVLYAVGYAVMLFLASLFAGVAMASRGILAHGELLARGAAGILVVIGGATFAYGYASYEAVAQRAIDFDVNETRRYTVTLSPSKRRGVR